MTGGGLRFPTILFDLDGTLTDPRVGITRGVQHALATAGVVVDDADELVSYIGPPIHDALVEQHAVAAELIDPVVAEYRRYYRERGMYENVLYDGVPALLEDLRAVGAVLAVATSKPQEVAVPILEHFAIASSFAFIGGASLDGVRRSKADVIEHTLDALGPHVDRAATVIVGDRMHDVAGAKATGISSIGVRWGYAPEGELEAAGAGAIVDTVDELRSALLAR